MSPKEFFDRFSHVKDWDSLLYFLENLPLGLQIFFGLVAFGLLLLVYIFFVALIVDKHN